MRYRVWICAAVGALVLAAPATVHAQSVGGTVRDESGRALAGVTVAVEGAVAGQPRTAATDRRGRWNMNRLPPGQYTLTLSLAGFQPVVRHDVVVASRGSVVLDIALQQAAAAPPGERTTVERARDTSETLATLPLARGLSTLLPAVPDLPR